MRLATLLLTTTAFAVASPAFAAPEPQTAAPAAADATATESGEGEAIVVYGTGKTRQVQEVSGADLAIQAAGTSPLRAIQKLPSVNFQSADAFGTYEWSTRITLRGFNQNQLGFNLDGIPLGDMSYGNNNGLHISRAISAENIGRTVVSQGSGSIDTQSTNNLGGTLNFYSIDPKEALGLDASGTYGSNNTWRGFLRGGIGTRDGARAFASVVYATTDKWKGDGKQRQLNVNAKGVVPLGSVTLDGTFSYSNRAEQDYQDLSLDQIKRLGYDWDNFGPGQYALAIQVADIAANRGDTGTTPLNPSAGTVYPGKIKTADDAYYDASGLRRDTLASVGLLADLAQNVTLKARTYFHKNEGQGTWGSPYVNSPTGVPMALRTTEYDINRKGLFASVNAELGMNSLTVGAWYENNDFNQARRFYAYASRTNPGRDHLKFQRDPFFTQWEVAFNTKTFQYYVEDEIKLGDAKISLGWKGFKVDNHARPIVAGGRTQGDLATKDWFQPHVGASYKFTPEIEAFAGFTQVTRAFTSATTAGPFSSSQVGFDAIKPFLKPEQSDTYEAGLRYTSGIFNGVLAGYLVNFRNRLLAIPTSVGIVGAANALQNVGGVRSAGIEASGEVRFGRGWSALASYSYNDNTYRNDVVIRTKDAQGNDVVTTIPTAGKTVTDSPKHLIHGEVSYDQGPIYGRVGVDFMSKRYFTYTNDKSVPRRALVDATLGYRIDLGMRKPVELQINATNLLDKSYVATIGSNGFGNSGDNQTLLAGAPRQVFATIKVGF
ncbi:TonB-dependent receptor [Novosphingobium sp. PASSN1]|uniref:TonB-dependent receptor n=1 Tax=Novosphingobium sp. PASSN1 TaxID=2015561 RepID=UPI000BD40037|nr:TonB-dependent receptor [Novosphingobium sp. PASSN1]OYU36170.1 MAG: TonB-dependent receptor [Novosphingobium sp. PASSN1]